MARAAVLAAAATLSIVLFAQPSSPAPASRPIDFARDIRPILSDKCFACHGPDVANNKSKLRLDTEAHALADLGNGRRAIVRGDVKQSQLVRRVTAEHPALRMPPAYSPLKLTKEEIARLTEWVAQGAPWQQHWSFVAPKRPAPPQVKDRTWARNAIDAFVLERLEKEGLHPSPEADRATLIRRVSLDLTGLPPTLEEIDAYVNDRSADAYEKLMDRLLASPRYGERMAFRWLDAARYADTNGYQIDGEREMWRWRDWVIEAFNRNMPFDQFATEQIAGDLLPNPTLDQRIATAFNRNHRGNSEDGLVPEEYAVEYVVDRVDTVSTVFLGLTMGCARCHSHKYDPISHKEYYQLYAYFNNIREDGRFSNFGNAAPWMPAPTREQQREFARLDSEIGVAGRQLQAALDASAAQQAKWEETLTACARHWFPADGLMVHQPFDEGAPVLARSVTRRATVDDQSAGEEAKRAEQSKPAEKEEEIGFNGGAPRYAESPLGRAVAFDGTISYDAGPAANFDYRDRVHDFKDRFAISAWFYPESENSGAIVTRMSDKVTEQENNLPKGRGYGLFFVDGKLHFNLISVWADDSFRVETESPLPVRQWHHVLATFDSLEPYDKVGIWVNGRKRALKINNGRLFRQFANSGGRLRIGGGPQGPESNWSFRGLIDEVRIYNKLPGADDIAVLACADPLAGIAAIPPDQRSEGQRLKIRNAFLEEAAPEAARLAWKRLRDLRRERFALDTSVVRLMVMQELPEPRPAFLLKRGSYDAPAERVERGVPAVLPPLDKGLPNNRLGLARWLMNAENPLTARVTVNRFWQMFFGTGLVKTAEDFGAQGELPSHPELLDWLAVEFREGGWDVKALLKQIVMSAAYRQSSKTTPELQQRDPENRLLARGPRLRLPAETIRDQALFASGLLVEKLGGPSVRPYQPEGLYNDMTFSNMTGYALEEGEGLWRRSLYTFWKRTVMPPAMQVFDASARESCTVRETRTNTPLQALNLMNDTTYVEAARLLAERMMKAGPGPEERIARGLHLAAGRLPDANETHLLLDNLTAQLRYFKANPKEAARLLEAGVKPYDTRVAPEELAAYSMTASLILNLDEVITKQ